MADSSSFPVGAHATAETAPGASPFHVKGVLYRGTQEYFAKEVPGGIEALYAQLADDPALLAFIQQTFLPSSWYDVLPAARLIRAEARAVGLTLARYLRLRTRYQAERDIGGVYRVLLKLASPDLVANRLPRLMAQMFDFGTTDTRVLATGHLDMRMRAFPAALVDWYVGCFGVYADVALRLAGAQNVAVTTKTPLPDGDRDGIPLVVIGIEVRYS